MSRVVLDASAILALLGGEPGSEHLTPELLSNAICSTVNLAEVQSKLVSQGIAREDAWEAATSPIREAADFTPAHAELAGTLMLQTRSLGLSLGDRACLALALTAGGAVYTADSSWKKLKLRIPVRVIR
ncbi:MAG: type II toxin-antitoxin system VapC family toxin [Acidobacteria bacterium]|nr:type II toxin-antitoxin system VapC family toxin [Acidobacteriota bacterium]